MLQRLTYTWDFAVIAFLVIGFLVVIFSRKAKK